MAGERKFDILEKLTRTGPKRIGGTTIISPLPSSLVSTQSPYSLSLSLRIPAECCIYLGDEQEVNWPCARGTSLKPSSQVAEAADCSVSEMTGLFLRPLDSRKAVGMRL